MGRKGKWFSNLKKVLSPESKEKKEQKSKEKFVAKQKHLGPGGSEPSTLETISKAAPPQPEEVKLIEAENEQNKPASSVAVTATATADTVVASTQAAAEVVRRTTAARFAGKSKEEVAAIKIQTAFRGYLARRALHALRGLVRLKLLMEGSVVKRQAANTLRCMQTLSRVQCQIRTRRIRMLEENQALQRQLLQKHAKELANLQMGEEWDDSLQSKEQIETSLLNKHEATMRRERALAYAFTHQQNSKNSSKFTNPLFTDPRNPSWGWSWLERWMAARPWEGRSLIEKDMNSDHSSVKGAIRSTVVGEISKASPSPTASQKPKQATSLQSFSTPSKRVSPIVARKLKSASPRGSIASIDDDTKSMVSVQSERNRRHSIGGGSSVRDDESLASSPSLPSYMVPTESARAKTRLQSPLGAEANGTPERGSNGPAKKKLSYPASPARVPRRHSGPPKLDSSINSADVGVVNAAAS